MDESLDAESDLEQFSGPETETSATVMPEEQSTQLGGRRLRCLIVEDDDVQQELLVQYLQSMGLETLVAGTIERAWYHLENAKIEIAIVDIQLPDGNGLHFCESVVDDPRYLDLPIIILSSMDPDNIVRKSRASGASFFVGKPYDPNVLLLIIERLLGPAEE
ncbi:MAG: response regulator [Planctomycetales bacterium]|nr:response regulator [Planctomycetales bacterium]